MVHEYQNKPLRKEKNENSGFDSHQREFCEFAVAVSAFTVGVGTVCGIH